MLLLALAMETPTNAVAAPSATEEDDTKGSEDQASEEGFGRDVIAEVPEYERLRQANLRKNALKLQELGVPILAASLKESTTTCSTEAATGEGIHANHATVKSTHRASASSLENPRLG